MSIDKKRPVYVVGHKNPDTDSICSAIAYANLKNILNEGENFYIAGKLATVYCPCYDTGKRYGNPRNRRC